MAEQISLTTSETEPSSTSYSISNIYFDIEASSIKVTIKSNTGKTYLWRLTPDTPELKTEILNGLAYINQGKFKTVQNKTLNTWILEQIVAKGAKIGTVTTV